MEYCSKIDRVMDLLLMLALGKATYQLAMASSVCWSCVEEGGWTGFEKSLRV